VLAAPAVSCAMNAKRCAHEHTGTAGALRHSLRNGLTAYAALSLETNSSCLHHCRLDGSIDPVGSNSPPAAWHQPRVSGPHGFAVRIGVVRPARREPLTGMPRPAATLRADALASTASRLAFVTIAIRPLVDGTLLCRKHPSAMAKPMLHISDRMLPMTSGANSGFDLAGSRVVIVPVLATVVGSAPFIS
jgi:hypothetical protein